MSSSRALPIRFASSGVRSFCLISRPNWAANSRMELLPLSSAAISFCANTCVTASSLTAAPPMRNVGGINSASTAVIAAPSMVSVFSTPSIRITMLLNPAQASASFHGFLRNWSCKFLFDMTSATNSDRLLFALTLVMRGSALAAAWSALSSRTATRCISVSWLGSRSYS